MAEVVKQLLRVLSSLEESAKFCTSGSVPPVLPGLEVEGVGAVGLPVSASVARQLIEVASQAPYGLGEETIVDTNVRRVSRASSTASLGIVGLMGVFQGLAGLALLFLPSLRAFFRSQREGPGLGLHRD